MGGIWWLVMSALTAIPMLKLLPHFGMALLWWMGMKLQELEKL